MRPIAAAAVLALVATACTGTESGTTPTSTTSPATTADGAATTTSGSETPPTTTPPAPDTPIRGVALSPRSYDSEDFTEFIDELAPAAGDLLMHNARWAEATDPEGGYDVVAQIAPERGLEPLFILSVGNNQGIFEPLDEDTRSDLLDGVLRLVDSYQPRWLGLGNEVNDFAHADPEGFEAFVSLFDEAAEAIHEASPGTDVFVVFQYELLIGRGDGVFGGEITDPEWDMLDRFPAADMVAFTTYPGLIFGGPEDVPADYYDPIRDHTSLPVAFTEVGWPAGDVIPGYHGSEEAQATWVDRFFELTERVEPVIAIWPFVYDTLLDPDDFAAFTTIGLVRPDGTKRPAWERWVESG